MDWNSLTYERAVLDELETAAEGLLTPPRPSRLGSLRPDAVLQRADGALVVIEIKFVGSSARDLHFSSIAQAAAYARALEGDPATRVIALVVTDQEVSERLRVMADQLRILIRTVRPDMIRHDVRALGSELQSL